MPDEGLPRMTVRFNGLFDFDGLYSAIIDWTKNYGYRWHEVAYKHKVPVPTGAEQEFTWLITKKVTDYISYRILFTVHMWDLLDVEVDVDGGKKSLSNARLYIWMDGTVEYDWQEKFAKGGRFAQFLGTWYEKLIRPVETVHWDTLYYRMWNLQAIIKKYFDMQSKKYAYKGYLGES